MMLVMVVLRLTPAAGDHDSPETGDLHFSWSDVAEGTSVEGASAEGSTPGPTNSHSASVQTETSATLPACRSKSRQEQDVDKRWPSMLSTSSVPSTWHPGEDNIIAKIGRKPPTFASGRHVNVFTNSPPRMCTLMSSVVAAELEENAMANNLDPGTSDLKENSPGLD